jgi:hypothetical protein
MHSARWSLVGSAAAVAVIVGACGGSNSGDGSLPDTGIVQVDASKPPVDATMQDVATLAKEAAAPDVALVDAHDAFAPFDATKDVAAPHDTGVDSGVSDAKAPPTDAPKSNVCTAGPNEDKDMDGWTIAQGDCNDCDPNVNPGAIDVAQTVGADGGLTPAVDSDCDGKFDPPQACDVGLALADVDANDGAKSIELCQFTTETPATPKEKIWGVISAAYVRADGTAFATPGTQVGLQSTWGTNVVPQGGSNMLAMSSGRARVPNQAGVCGSETCEGAGAGTAPPNFPQDNPSCPPSQDINDDVALEVTVRAPTNATGYRFNIKFHSFEFPYWVCNEYNDQFIALVSPAPVGAINGNIAFDSLHNPVSVNLGFFDVCSPADKSDFAASCFGTCPTPANPYCPAGSSQLLGTGFDVWEPETDDGVAGATSWLVTQAPVQGGTDVTIRFAIWDTGDDAYDSTILIDNFQWIATAGTVAVGTHPWN